MVLRKVHIHGQKCTSTATLVFEFEFNLLFLFVENLILFTINNLASGLSEHAARKKCRLCRVFTTSKCDVYTNDLHGEMCVGPNVNFTRDAQEPAVNEERSCCMERMLDKIQVNGEDTRIRN